MHDTDYWVKPLVEFIRGLKDNNNNINIIIINYTNEL